MAMDVAKSYKIWNLGDSWLSLFWPAPAALAAGTAAARPGDRPGRGGERSSTTALPSGRNAQLAPQDVRAARAAAAGGRRPFPVTIGEIDWTATPSKVASTARCVRHWASGTTCSGGPQLHLANQLHLSSSTRRVAVLVVQYGVMMSPDHSVTISAFRVAYLVLLHLGHHMLQQRAQPERAHRACAEWRA